MPQSFAGVMASPTLSPVQVFTRALLMDLCNQVLSMVGTALRNSAGTTWLYSLILVGCSSMFCSAVYTTYYLFKLLASFIPHQDTFVGYWIILSLSSPVAIWCLLVLSPRLEVASWVVMMVSPHWHLFAGLSESIVPKVVPGEIAYLNYFWTDPWTHHFHDSLVTSIVWLFQFPYLVVRVHVFGQK